MFTSFIYMLNVSKCCNSLWKKWEGRGRKTVSWNYNKITTQGGLKTLKHYYKHPSQWPPPTQKAGHLGPSNLAQPPVFEIMAAWKSCSGFTQKRKLAILHKVKWVFYDLIMEIIWHSLNGSPEIISTSSAI